jgi:hypothetical protein
LQRWLKAAGYVVGAAAFTATYLSPEVRNYVAELKKHYLGF